MTIIDQDFFHQINRPSQYLGNEINAQKKDFSTVDVSVALAFPDIYEVGMSHQGLKILYNILNRYEWIAAERVYSPWTDLEKELRQRNLPLETLESNLLLNSFDIIGFSLQHELSYTNTLNMLELSHIPFMSEDRDDTFPLIIGGGPACFNPEPIADFFDAIVIGDGEKVIIDICEIVRAAKNSNSDKQSILKSLTNIQGIYIPSFFKPHYNNDGSIDTIEPVLKGYNRVQKALIPMIDKYPFPSDQVVPFTRLIHDRLSIEISRGCTRGCRFCQAGMIYRPVRERHPDSVISNVEKALKLTGFEEISLLSLSSGDYSCIAPLIKELMDRQSDKRIAVSLPSLRIDSLDPSWMEQIKRVRKTGFTLAPEAGNDRLREIINKSLTDKDILDTAGKVYSSGWNLIKLYFMIGLPGEKEEDLHDIAKLAKQVVGLASGGGKKIKLNVSISTFVPKSHTPFMWSCQISPEESWRRINIIRDALRGTRVKVKWNQPELSWLEGIFSRGDRKLSKLVKEAWKLGARFDAWGDQFRIDIWQKAMENTDIDPGMYLYRTRSFDETLPWDHLSSGVKTEYLKREWKRSLDGLSTPDCRTNCLECGVCNHQDIDPVLCSEWSPIEKTGSTPAVHREQGLKRYRITFTKTNVARYISHLELARVFIRAFKRLDIDIAFSKGFHPMPKLSFTSALPVGTESLHETAEIGLYETMSISSFKEKLSHQLPSGISIAAMEDISHVKKKMTIQESHYKIDLNDLTLNQDYLSEFLKSDYYAVTKYGKKGKKEVNARDLVKSLEITPDGSINLVAIHIQGPALKPLEILKGIFKLKTEHTGQIKILKTKQVMG